MKIAIVAPVFYPYRAGMGRVVEREAEGLVRIGQEVTVFTPRYRGEKEQEIRAEVEIRRIRSRLAFGNAAWIGDLEQEWKKFEIMHFHFPFIGGVRAAVQFKEKHPQVPLAITYHMDLVGRGWKKYFFSVYERLALAKMIKAADKIIVSSLEYAQEGDLSPFLKKEQEKFIEIPFGLEAEKLIGGLSKKEARDKLKDTICLGTEEKVVLFVGVLDAAHYFKGVEVLIAAFQKYCANTPFLCRLAIVGEGERRSYYEDLVKRLNLADRVIFTGKISDEELSLFYRAADVLALPSLDRSEAYGLVLIEAQGRGTPVLASNLPGVRQQVAGGWTVQTGNIEDWQEKMKKILGDNQLREELGEKGKKWVLEKRSLKGEIERLMSVYNLLANK